MSSFRPDIWRLQANGDIQGLLQALEAEDSALRRRAAAALRTLGAVDAIPTLKRILDQEHDPETRSSILSALASLEMAVRGGPDDNPPTHARPTPQAQAVEALVLELGSSEPKKVVTAALKLAKLKDMRAVEALVVQFNNQAVPAKARLLIAEALLELDSAPGDVTVLGALRHAKPSIRRSAAAVLGQMQADWAVDPLVQALKDDDESVREAALAALYAIDTVDSRAAIPGLTKKTTTTTLAIVDEVALEEATTPPPSLPPAPAVSGPRDGLLRYIKSEASTAEPASANTAEQPAADQSGMLVINPSATPDDNLNENLQKLSWPKRDLTPEEKLSKMQTRPLDPSRLEEAKDRLEGQDQESEAK